MEALPREVKVTAMLADHAEVADGKLFVNGGGWTLTGPQPTPFAIAMLIDMPWNAAGAEHTARLELIDAQGGPVMVGDQPVIIQAGFSMTPAPGVKRGTPLTVPVAIVVGPTPIPPGGRYEWRLEINGETHEDWRLGFNTRPEAQSNVA